MEEAIDYFNSEIEQMSIMLGGVLTPQYRTFIQKKIRIYNLASAELERIIMEKEMETSV